MRENISILDYQYDLPEEKIAKYPLEKRDTSKLLVYKNETISETSFCNLSGILPQKSLLVLNDTKVIRARMLFKKPSGAQIEIFCLEPHTPSDYYQSFQSKGVCAWNCIVGNLKKWKEGYVTCSLNYRNSIVEIKAEKIQTANDSLVIRFSWDNSNISFGEILEIAGNVPIPPYLNRESENIDRERYQTVYAQPEGSVAAPTAGLHFSETVLNELKLKKIEIQRVTLHVGAGTFKPVKSSNALEHPMHTEKFIFNRQVLEKMTEFSGNITAVGTTTLRTLESIYWIGVKIHLGLKDPLSIHQFEAYHYYHDLSLKDSINTIIHFFNENSINQIEASTSIMIFPSYNFKVVNRLITNFHQPQSTLLLLVAAFIGEQNWKKIYNYALDHNYRFLSYGDSSLLIR